MSTVIPNHNPALYAVQMTYFPAEHDEEEYVYTEQFPIIAWKLEEDDDDDVLFPIALSYRFKGDLINHRRNGFPSTEMFLIFDKSTGKLHEFPVAEVDFDSLVDAENYCLRHGRDYHKNSKLKAV